jgi:hypothetical protein
LPPSGKIIQKLSRYLAAFGLVAGVVGRLSAAGLVGIVMHFAADSFQHLHHVHGRLGEKLVYKARNEYINDGHMGNET